MPLSSFSYYDPRHADTYVIELDGDGEFLCALRYVTDIGRDPIIYDHLADVPQPIRSALESEIFHRARLPHNHH